ncbi:MAG TPA: hypothetical protein VGF63_00650 [Solirubrobacteraceae bacterium]
MGVSRTTASARRRRKRRRPPWAAVLSGKRTGPVRRRLPGAAKPPVWKALLAPPRPGPATRVLRGARRSPWKVVGLAGLAGVAATGVVVARNRRTPSELAPDALRERLHARLAEAGAAAGPDDPRPPPA